MLQAWEQRLREKADEPQEAEVRDPLYPQQDKFVLDTADRVAACTTRRAGKSTGLALRFIRAMQRHPRQTCRYIALTRESAKSIMWPVLQEVDERFKLGAKFLVSQLLMVLPNGAAVQLYGADMKNFVKRLKGVKSPAVAVDEAQDFSDHLRSLVEDVLEPTLADFSDSWLAITGTPGPIPRGYFYDIAHGLEGYTLHSWSLFDNPYLPDPRGYVAKLKRKHKWADDNPTLLREYYGQWKLDVASLLIKYSATKNHYDELPKLPKGDWHYLLGVDLGYRDADALATLAWHESTPNIYLVDEEITPRQDITDLAQAIKRKIARYNPSKIVMDTGALGIKIAEELRRRFHIPVHEADKKRKFENVTFLNGYLDEGKFFAKKDSRFAQDSYRVQIDWEKSTPDRLVVRAGFHSDIIDAVLYPFKESPAFTYTKPVEKPKPGTKEFYDQEVSDMEQAAIDYFTEQENAGLPQTFGLPELDSIDTPTRQWGGRS